MKEYGWYTLDLPDDDLEIEGFKSLLGIKDDEIDADFGLIAMPGKTDGVFTYNFMVTEECAKRIRESYPQMEGPWSNARMEPFGPAGGAAPKPPRPTF